MGRAAIVATGTAAVAALALLPAAPAGPVASSPSAAALAATPATAARPAAHSPAALDTALDASTALVPSAAPPAVTAEVTPAAVRTPLAAARSSAMLNALGKLGARYRYGAAGPSAFDCSGLVYWSYRQIGVTLPRTSRAMSGVGTAVSKSNLQPGDLVFFYRPVSHVAIYIGNGQVVHASTPGSPVKISTLNAMPFTTARRV